MRTAGGDQNMIAWTKIARPLRPQSGGPPTRQEVAPIRHAPDNAVDQPECIACQDDPLDPHVLSHKDFGENFVGGANRKIIQEKRLLTSRGSGLRHETAAFWRFFKAKTLGN
jgi:hypothetical protein